MHLSLFAHPDTPPANPSFEVWASVDHAASFGAVGTLNIWFGIRAPAERFVIEEDEARRADDLWQTTCFEAFLRADEAESYREWNFAPSGQWAAYDFTAYRDGRTDAEVKAPYIRMEDNLTWWTLGATIGIEAGPHWQLGLSAILEEKDGTRSYWALAHADGEPDFHDPGCFAARLASATAMTLFGIDRLLAEPELRRPLEGKRVALVAHPASVTSDLTHSLDALKAAGLNITAAFGPQHGLKGDKQDNMVESDDFTDPVHGIPVFSLYGQVRRPTGQSMGTFDVVLVDLQDLGCRIYTFITTLLYMLEAAAEHGKAVWVLDRPNPAGRPIEGLTLREGWESFVGAGPIPMRHGLTLGELGQWFVRHFKLDVDYRVTSMDGWKPDAAPGFGWPEDRIWVNPSPNAPNLNMARCYAGTVMLEGTTLSEGRGTTRPLELFGAPDIDALAVMKEMERLAPAWLAGCKLRETWFEPTFHKHVGKLCSGVHIHAEGDFYHHAAFKPWRLQALAFKAIRNLQPDYELWRDFPYEYAFGKLPIDVINGSSLLREWVDDPASGPGDLDLMAVPDEQAWNDERADLLRQ